MTHHKSSLRAALLAGSVLAASPALAAEVTPERLLNPDKEPQNWLMNHRSYDGQRFSPLARINKDNVKGLKLVYAVPLVRQPWQRVPRGDAARRGRLPLHHRCLGRALQDRRHLGQYGPRRVAMDPKQERAVANRGAALWGNLVISPASTPARIIATDKITGKVAWETNVSDAEKITVTGAPLADQGQDRVRRVRRRQRRARLDGGARCRDRQAAVAQVHHSGAGRAGRETWKDKTNAWQTGGGAVWVTGSYDPDTNQTLWGVGNPVPMMDARARPGDNLFTNSVVSWDPDNGKMNWYFQYTPGDMWDFDEVGTHILFERTVNGERRKLVTHSARNGFLYTMERANGAMVGAKPYVEEVNWTKGIDQKTGKPLDYDPNKDVQTYSGLADPTSAEPIKKVCPTRVGGNNYFPSSYSPKTQMVYIPAMTACEWVTNDKTIGAKRSEGWFVRSGGGYKVDSRYESTLTAVDPVTQEIKKKVRLAYPNYSGALSTAGGMVVRRADGRHGGGLRRPDARRAVEDQSRLRLRRAADDVRGQRQAIHGDRVGTEPDVADEAPRDARAQGPAQRDRALRVRAVSGPTKVVIPGRAKARTRNPVFFA